MESNTLAEGPKWVAKGLLDLKEHEQTPSEEPASPNLNLALGTPVFDQTPVSEIKPVNISKNIEEDLDEDLDEDEYNHPLI